MRKKTDDENEKEVNKTTKKPLILHKKGGRHQFHDWQQGERPPECKQQLTKPENRAKDVLDFE
ncbi:hypothetical protein DY000_02064409 [Brassica cretica]|uniref:RIN4 pathogenic type III effector avirulence factor Avr cleavage site domain-containing protein n=1 Tax=Brassica cretica TaxID=69181 RepID=A0ABQ7ANJ6_BRACR|nr:hypothetical protein DY000_02064409 [Brassica cretica]